LKISDKIFTQKVLVVKSEMYLQRRSASSPLTFEHLVHNNQDDLGGKEDITGCNMNILIIFFANVIIDKCFGEQKRW
jgi:hypothetical protein